MLIHILSPLWGHEHLSVSVFLKKISDAGYDGIDTWIPDDKKDRKVLFDYLQTTGKVMVAHQHAASGNTFQAFKRSFLRNLRQCAEPSPLLINSHTGRDYFSFAQNLELVDIAHDFSVKTGIPVLHETHRGRLGYSPQMLDGFFSVRSELPITADFSHWVCVTESMLENFSGTLKEAIDRTRHIH
ncbi:MAG: sugar phosphate isomerase/epimerase, partial [Mucilaginibacter polytrichastri]|nr:sugar phosphate isomerase/epimerase [Mucilaginibacter polytrichastri]